MEILVVAATTDEIELTIRAYESPAFKERLTGKNVHVLVTEVGMTATAFALGRELSNKHYDLAINAGIAGAFDRSLSIGEVVFIYMDCFSELGAEDGSAFIPLDELGLGKTSIRPDVTMKSFQLPGLRKARSITVNKVHGKSESISDTVRRLNPQTESMEGGAFFYSCNKSGIPCVQLRAVSNYVEQRNRAAWNIPLAIRNLNETLQQFLIGL